MDIDPPKQVEDRPIKDKDLFKAAETGDSSAFESLSPQHLSKSLSLRNEDSRPEVVKILSNVDESAKVINSADEERWALIHSAASIGNTEIVEKRVLSKGCSWL